MRVRFGDFLLDTDRRELSRAGAPVPLRPKALQLLEVLVENRPKAMSQEELYDRLWPETFVDKASVHKLIYHLRQILADEAQTIIRTSYGFGFSFAATCVDDAADVSHVQWQVVVGDLEFTLRRGENLVGRGHDAVVRIEAASISRRHARIVIDDGRATIEDLRSKNGTSVDGKRIHTRELNDGDRILFGTVAASFRVIPAEPSTDTVV